MTQREGQLLQLIRANPMLSQQELADKLGITRSSVAVHISNLIKKGFIAGKGYVLPHPSYTVVVGGANVDIGGRSGASLVAGDSNPGFVTTSLGGVGRNIAHNLALLGQPVRLLTACGDDFHGRQLISSCEALGIDTTRVLRLPDCATSTYLYLADEQGEMALAVSDMRVCQRITPQYLAANLPLLQSAQAVVCDTNLPQESLSYLAEHLTVPIFADPVSTKKAGKLIPILSKLHTLKPNALEAELLTGIPIRGPETVEEAANRLLELGVKRVFLSLGAKGVYAAEQGQGLWLPCLEGARRSTTGCGDAFMAALVWAYLEGWDLSRSAYAGLAAASIAMESNETINPAIGRQAVLARMSQSNKEKELC